MNNEKRKSEIVNLFLISLGEALCELMNDGDFSRIRMLKESIDEMFFQADRAVQQSKIKAASGLN